MKKKVYIEEKEDFVEVAITVNGALEHFYRLENNLAVGSIVLGKVEKIIKQLGIFVNIGREKNALLQYRENLRIGDMVTVQILRDEEGDKGCAITEKITLAGRYLVLNDLGDYGFSRKLSQKRKEELPNILPDMGKAGFVFRSSAEKASDKDIIKEAQTLLEKYKNILDKAKNNSKIQFLHEEKGIEAAKRFAENDEDIIYSFAEIQDQFNQIYERKIEVEGVQIVFDKTEAMTVIDVNSHKFKHQYKDMDSAHYEANVIAVREIAKQIRLRNIGGIIMIDFISLISSDLKNKLLEELCKELKKDNVNVRAELIENLSLIAVVRKKRYAEN